MPVLRFVLLCFGWSWVSFAWAYAGGHFHNGVVASDFSMFVIFALGPAIAGLILAFAERRIEPMGITLGIRVRPNKWWFVARSLPVVLCFGAVLATALAGFTLHEPTFIGGAADHCHALALYFAFYNFVKMHSTLRMSPATAAGVEKRLWEMSNIVALIDARAEAPKRPATYRKATNGAEISN